MTAAAIACGAVPRASDSDAARAARARRRELRRAARLERRQLRALTREDRLIDAAGIRDHRERAEIDALRYWAGSPRPPA
jgi:hypothetical protein